MRLEDAETFLVDFFAEVERVLKEHGIPLETAGTIEVVTMKRFKIQGHAALREEMKAVARGESPAPKDAGGMTFDSVEALLRLQRRRIANSWRSFVTGSPSPSPNSRQ